jgi:phage gp46-like protein
MAYSLWGGLPQPWLDFSIKSYGLGDDKLELRGWLLTTLPSDANEYLQQNLRWFVLDEKDEQLNVIADRWQQENIAVTRAQFGHLRIIELSK